MKIELGKTYVTRKGFNVTIKGRLENPVYNWLFKGDNNLYYAENGMMSFDGSEEMEGDLVGEITDKVKNEARINTSSESKHEPVITKIEPDMVNSPSHYTQGAVECIDAIQSALSPEEFRGYLKGNILKYMWRTNQKGGKQDLEKSLWYLNKLIEATE